jgi:hypothetical protein
MIFTICKHGETVPGIAIVTLHVCDNCAEYYLDDFIASQVYGMGERAFRDGADVQARGYVA